MRDTVSDRKRFYSVINQYRFLAPYWDQERHEIKLKEFEERLGTMSTGEKHLAKFMAAVWSHEDNYGFDIVDALNFMDGAFAETIKEWVADPYWP